MADDALHGDDFAAVAHRRFHKAAADLAGRDLALERHIAVRPLAGELVFGRAVPALAGQATAERPHHELAVALGHDLRPPLALLGVFADVLALNLIVPSRLFGVGERFDDDLGFRVGLLLSLRIGQQRQGGEQTGGEQPVLHV